MKMQEQQAGNPAKREEKGVKSRLSIYLTLSLTLLSTYFILGQQIGMLKSPSIPWYLNMRKTTRTKVILLSYSRSGSSLLGELLTAHDTSSYYFEPLRQMKMACNHFFNNTPIADSIATQLTGLLDCKPYSINSLERFSRRSRSLKCERTTLSLVKTIRLRMTGLLPWIESHPSIKIIHLIRDPRSQEKSRLRMRGNFKCSVANVTEYCSAVANDLRLSLLLPPHRYKRVRYEDLVDHPEEMMGELYSFIDVPYTPTIKQFVINHFHAETIGKNKTLKPMSTYKLSTFNNTDFRAKVPEEILRLMEESCATVFRVGGYL